MDLWIRSQDKEVLTKCNNLCYMSRKDVLYYLSVDDLTDDMEHFVWSPDGAILGVYKSKERALEVLDEIQNNIKSFCILKHTDNSFNENNEYIGCNVYEMPTD